MKIRVQGGKRTFKRRVTGALVVGSTGLVSTVAIAGGIVLSLSSGFDTGGSVLKWLEPALSVLTISTLTAAGPATSGGTAPSDTTVVKTAGGTTGSGSKSMELGINLNLPAYYAQERMFVNLASGGGRKLINTSGQYVSVPADRMDANYDVIRLDPGERIVTGLSIPTKAYRGVTVDIVCRWKGTITKAEVWGPTVRNAKYAKNSATFTWVPGATPVNASFYYSGMSSSDPLRGLDCRETDASPTATFDPTFLDNVKRYSTVRFLNWTTAVNDNRAVTWATRNKPGSGAYNAADGVALEYMIQLANETQTNPWFNIPWNADAEYVRKMAELVRDTLDPRLKAHVEVSNEVWNWLFLVTSQARDEGVAANMSTNPGIGVLYRYAQKTGEVMDVWSSVFAGQMQRIVRIAATQNNPENVRLIMLWKDTSKKVDAVATAPYFGGTLPAGQFTTVTARDNFFNTTAPAKIDETIGIAKQVKAMAANYNLRYIAYEGGQHFVSSDVDQLKLIQRDPRMGKMYTRYLTAWQSQIGDLLTLFQDVGPVSSYGAWGAQEYAGQPLSEAPKANAIDLFRKSYLARK
ncbi:hypothetical protein [Sphingobium nicotianae]|uniref:Uncharacterized protein n=1 Tax=Sphingobium nicotianae TaxID=2782607 RepID=A0A9X1DGF1_9SPHN|nr:hypothetical protein [Sphingobium nicotianae]MBT2188958.1 hypothetical protein [Sphingobium nicotianae]